MVPDMCQHVTVCAVSHPAHHDSRASSPDTGLRLRPDPAAGEYRRRRALGGAGAAPCRQPPHLLGLRYARSRVRPTQATLLPFCARAGPAGRAGVRHAPRQLQLVQQGQGREGALGRRPAPGHQGLRLDARRLGQATLLEGDRLSLRRVLGMRSSLGPMAVRWGRAHVRLNDIRVLGVDEIDWHKGHQYLMLEYQLDSVCRCRSSAGPAASSPSFATTAARCCPDGLPAGPAARHARPRPPSPARRSLPTRWERCPRPATRSRHLPSGTLPGRVLQRQSAHRFPDSLDRRNSLAQDPPPSATIGTQAPKSSHCVNSGAGRPRCSA